MTLLKPGGIREFAAANYARQMRLLSTILLQGASGRVGLNDFNATPSATTMDVQLAAGAALVQMPGLYQGANVFASDAALTKTLATAPGSGSRYDVIGIQVWDQEYGDGTDDWDIVYIPNPVLNTTALPTPATPSAAWLPIVQAVVPAKVTAANRCTFSHIAGTAALLRSGGYTGGDLALPPQDVVTAQTNIVRAGGWVYSFVVPAPLTYRTIELVFTWPLGGTPNVVGSYVLDKSRCTPNDFWFRVNRPDGQVLDQGSGIGYDAIYKT